MKTTPKSAGASQAVRAITTALCAAALVVTVAFGAPDASSSRWDDDVDAHSEALAGQTTETAVTLAAE